MRPVDLGEGLVAPRLAEHRVDNDRLDFAPALFGDDLVPVALKDFAHGDAGEGAGVCG